MVSASQITFKSTIRIQFEIMGAIHELFSWLFALDPARFPVPSSFGVMNAPPMWMLCGGLHTSVLGHHFAHSTPILKLERAMCGIRSY